MALCSDLAKKKCMQFIVFFDVIFLFVFFVFLLVCSEAITTRWEMMSFMPKSEDFQGNMARSAAID